MYLKTLLSIIALAIFPFFTAYAADITVNDDDIQAGQTVNWTKDNVYHLNRLIFVEEGATLNIEAGTVIKGMPGQEHEASALVICRGAQIFAEGTADEPIIFTNEADDPYSLDDQPITETGKWGGLIILGKATCNNPSGEGQIEGISENEARGKYGAPHGEQDPNDNSGVLRYVSIRHGGVDIGADNEINGVSFGAVGRGTTVEFVEVWYNADDGFEFFGGDVETRFLVSAFNKDDSFDYDEGFRGKGQFWFSIQAPNRGNMAGEHDGGNKPDDSEPYAIPYIYNATYIGSGITSDNSKSKGIHFRDNAGGKYFNSIFIDTKGRGLDIEDLASGHDSRERLENGDLKVQNNIWWNIGGEGATIEAICPDVTGEDAYSQDFVRTYLADAKNANYLVDPKITKIDRGENSMLDPRPAEDSPAFFNARSPIYNAHGIQNDFFVEADYIGAFNDKNWLANWTFLSNSGILSNEGAGVPELNLAQGVDEDQESNIIVVNDDDINAGDKIYWTKNNTYHLNRKVFVEEGAELHIEAGTVIKGLPGKEHEASALVICRDAKIFAEGTASEPIIFTYEADDPHSFDDLPLTETGKWGGLIILGRSVCNNPSGEGQIEGISENEPRGKYGAPHGQQDLNDDSGILRYVSIRHGGVDIGADNEINGVSFGAVGSGTTVEFVEVWYNADDGFEFFGGNVETRYLISAFNKDDSFDYDEGFSGKGQYWFSIQAPNRGNMGGEHDGGNKPDDSEPFAIPYIYNATYIGSGLESENPKSKGIHFRDNAGGKYFNSIFMDTKGRGLDIEDLATGHDSRERLENGDLKLQNNIWWNIAIANPTLAEICPDVSGEDAYLQGFVRDYLAQNSNTVVDPQIRSISREEGGMMDPRPEENSPVFDLPRTPIYKASTNEDNTFFEDANFIGAFGDKNWAAYWTLLSRAGYFANDGAGVPEFEVVAGVQETTGIEDENSEIEFISNYPNPFDNATNIEFAIKNDARVNISIFNTAGEKIETLLNRTMSAGQHEVNWDASELPAGAYMIRVETKQFTKTHKVVVN